MHSKRCKLIIDIRERNVTRHANEFENIDFHIQQITIGDYAVLTPEGGILAIIERKSLEDFSASIKDGRSNNKRKLIELREKTNCRIIYIIEGPEFPEPSRTFGNIPYKHIESSIFHLMVRDNISIIRTKNTLCTAKTLVRFINSMNTLVVKPDAEDTLDKLQFTTDLFISNAVDDNFESSNNPQVDEGVITNNINNNLIRANDQFDVVVGGVNASNTAATDENILNNAAEIMNNNITNDKIDTMIDTDIKQLHMDPLKMLTQRHEKTDHEISRELWSKFPRITTETADDYISKWSMAEIVRGLIPKEQISNFKLSTGRAVDKKVISVLTNPPDTIYMKLLTCIPGISVGKAKMLLQTATLRNLLSWNAESLAIIPCTQKGTKLGMILSERILRIFNYKFQKA